MEFNWGIFMMGAIITIIGAVVTVYHRKIADSLGGGMSDYDRYRLVGLITCGVGLLVAFNLINLILKFALGGLFQPLLEG